MATDFKRAHTDAKRALDRVQPPLLTVRLSTLVWVALALFALCAVAGVFYRSTTVYQTPTHCKGAPEDCIARYMHWHAPYE